MSIDRLDAIAAGNLEEWRIQPAPEPQPNSRDGWEVFLWVCAFACLPAAGAIAATLRFS